MWKSQLQNTRVEEHQQQRQKRWWFIDVCTACFIVLSSSLLFILHTLSLCVRFHFIQSLPFPLQSLKGWFASLKYIRLYTHTQWIGVEWTTQQKNFIFPLLFFYRLKISFSTISAFFNKNSHSHTRISTIFCFRCRPLDVVMSKHQSKVYVHEHENNTAFILMILLMMMMMMMENDDDDDDGKWRRKVNERARAKAFEEVRTTTTIFNFLWNLHKGNRARAMSNEQRVIVYELMLNAGVREKGENCMQESKRARESIWVSRGGLRNWECKAMKRKEKPFQNTQYTVMLSMKNGIRVHCEWNFFHFTLCETNTRACTFSCVCAEHFVGVACWNIFPGLNKKKNIFIPLHKYILLSTVNVYIIRTHSNIFFCMESKVSHKKGEYQFKYEATEPSDIDCFRVNVLCMCFSYLNVLVIDS